MTLDLEPVLAQGETRDRKIWQWSWPKSCTASKKKKYKNLPGHVRVDTLEDHFEVTYWDLHACFLGKRPLRDHKGSREGLSEWRKSLSGKNLCKRKSFRIVVWGVLGDQDFFVNTLGCKHWSCAEI